MPQPTPYEFRNAEALVEELSKRKSELGNWFECRKDSLRQIVHDAVGSNTFRAFRRMPRQPSVVFREWAFRKLNDPKTASELGSILSQTHYDRWVKRFCDTLNRTWQSHMGEPMPYGPRRKLPNLLLKEFVLWSGWSNAQRSRLTAFLHVPLDRYTLVAVRHCIDDPSIPKSATMKLVTNEQMYDKIQAAIRKITNKACTPAIYFDVLAWNVSH